MSPIIATILLVAITVVLAAVLYVLISGLTHGPGNTPIGTAFSVGNPTPSKCGATSTYAGKGCLTGDYVYTLTVETATASFGSVQFEVKSSSGSIVASSGGGFSVENIAGAIAAQSASSTSLAMTSTFTTYGLTPICSGAACSASTPFSSIYTIVIDMGTANPTGLGYSFIAIGTGSYSGTTTPLALH